MSFAMPLGVGPTSSAEYMDIELEEPISTEKAMGQLGKYMCEGLEILDFREVDGGKKMKAMTIVTAADYEVWFREESIYATRWLRNTYIVFPPYTNHSDQKEDYNQNGHDNYDHPELHKDHSKFIDVDGEPPVDPYEDWEMPEGGEKEIEEDNGGETPDSSENSENTSDTVPSEP